MARETLPAALTLMFGHEGGYVNNPADPGGPTKYGITLKTLRAARGKPGLQAGDVRALTVVEAEDIYRKSYWNQAGGDLLPAGLDYAVFDFGVNSGPATAVKKLQKLVGAGQDGAVGVQTVSAVNSYPGGLSKLIKDYCVVRMSYLRGLKTWGKFGRGWTIRVTGKDTKGQYAPTLGVVGNALKLMTGATVPAQQTPAVPSAKAPPSDIGITETLKKPEGLSAIGVLITAIGGLASGNGPVQWALGAAVVVGVGYGLWLLIKREESP